MTIQAEPSRHLIKSPTGTLPDHVLGGNSCSVDERSEATALGLVYSSTSDTPTPIDPRQSRIKRMKSGVLTASRLHTEQATKGGNRYTPVMVTLTYSAEGVWHERHIANFLKHVRQWMQRRGALCRYVWVMELTQAGRPHYHCLFWLPKGVSLPKPDKRGWWSHGMTRIERARSAVGYMAKYTSKGDSSTKFPSGARIHACGGLDKAARNERAWWLAPMWVRERWDSPAYRPRACAGGGWYSLETGEWEPSPYLVKFHAGGVYISRISEVEERGNPDTATTRA